MGLRDFGTAVHGLAVLFRMAVAAEQVRAALAEHPETDFVSPCTRRQRPTRWAVSRDNWPRTDGWWAVDLGSSHALDWVTPRWTATRTRRGSRGVTAAWWSMSIRLSVGPVPPVGGH